MDACVRDLTASTSSHCIVGHLRKKLEGGENFSDSLNQIRQPPLDRSTKRSRDEKRWWFKVCTTVDVPFMDDTEYINRHD